MCLWRPNPSAEGSEVSFWGRSCGVGRVVSWQHVFHSQFLGPFLCAWTGVPATSGGRPGHGIDARDVMQEKNNFAHRSHTSSDFHVDGFHFSLYQCLFT